jgi:predicted transposase YdaD
MPRHDQRFKEERLRRAELKLACLRRIARADLDDLQRFLLVNCVQTYLELSPGEKAQYESLEARERDKEVKIMATNWVERLENKYLRQGRKEGREEGRAEGVRKVLLRQLDLRFGPLPPDVRQSVAAISSVAGLNRLAEKVVTAQSLEEMGLG